MESRHKDFLENKQGLVVFMIFLLLVVQVVNLYFTIKPPSTPIIQGLTKQEQKSLKENKALLKKVAELTKIGEDEQALIVTITDIDALKKGNPLNEEVYKDAQNNDKVIGFNDRMIIYREADHKIIYEGQSPAQIQQAKYMEQLQPIFDEVGKLTQINPQAIPRLLTVTDADALRKAQPEIYKDAQAGDQVLVYTDRVIIFRPSTKAIVLDAPLQVQTTQPTVDPTVAPVADSPVTEPVVVPAE